jgi:hypothetical protein
MPTSTRRQAASRSQRYSEVSVGALSIDLAEEDDHQDVHGGQEEHNEDFGANGMSGE